MVNKKRITLFTIVQLAVSLLFGTVGFGQDGVQDFSHQLLTDRPDDFFQTYLQAFHNINDQGNPSELPEDWPLNEEENEVEEKDGGDDAMFFPSYPNHGILLGFYQEVFSFGRRFPSHRESVPLYVLFHCWKNYLV